MGMLDSETLSWMPQHLHINTTEDWGDPERNILLDDVYAREVASGKRPPTIRVWRHAPERGLVVSKRDVAGQDGEAAMQKMSDIGWPIIVRPTGGTAVPHGRGVLNLSFLLPRTAGKATTDLYYRILCQPMLDWLADLGLASNTGEVPGSYCDGNYNVIVDGLKLVGTAQAWRGGLAGMASRNPGYILAHACIMIDVDLDLATQAINNFYTATGDPYRVDRSTSTTLSERLLAHNLRSTRYDAKDAMDSLVHFLTGYYRAQGITCDRD